MFFKNGFVKVATRQAACILFVSLVLACIVNGTRSAPLIWVGDWSVKARVSAKIGQDGIITLEEAKALHASGNAVFLDARPDLWFEVGHISGAHSLPFEKFEEVVSNVMADVDKDSIIITYCDGESCELSHDLAAALMKKGFNNVRVLVNGWTLWNQNGLPIEGEF